MTFVSPQEKHDFLDRLVEKMVIKEVLGKILNKLSRLFDKFSCAKKPKSEAQYLMEIEELFEFLILCSESPLCRAFLKNRSHLMIPIFEHTLKHIASSFQQEYFYLSSFFTLFSNLLIVEHEKEENGLLDYI